MRNLDELDIVFQKLETLEDQKKRSGDCEITFKNYKELCN